jgi:hypothetical protein
MSCYYLCDYCDNEAMDVWLETCFCRARDMEHVAKKVMLDHHGKDGKRYEEPTDVCEHYVARRKS